MRFAAPPQRVMRGTAPPRQVLKLNGSHTRCGATCAKAHGGHGEAKRLETPGTRARHHASVVCAWWLLCGVGDCVRGVRLCTCAGYVWLRRI
eukprot:5798465-Prymnesium_polylepis.1